MVEPRVEHRSAFITLGGGWSLNRDRVLGVVEMLGMFGMLGALQLVDERKMLWQTRHVTVLRLLDRVGNVGIIGSLRMFVALGVVGCLGVCKLLGMGEVLRMVRPLDGVMCLGIRSGHGGVEFQGRAKVLRVLMV